MVSAAAQDKIQTDRIAKFVLEATSGDRNRMVALLRYPLRRPYPLKSIRSRAECLRRFDEVFDRVLISELQASDPKTGWELMGWRGIIFKNGSIWLTDDYKIMAINHETQEGKKALADAIAGQKKRLPSSLRDFDLPILEWKTRSRLIRIDLKGEDYRLVVRKRKDPSKILRLLHGGALHFDGQLGAYLVDWQFQGRTHRVFSGLDPSEDRYCVFPGLVESSDWPDHPELEDPRRD